ncbi:hypothetical protein PT276_03340 [Orbaceae bacterium ESL0721]|nr:hypothetical protein [Orbaceae bacterium ESL0721]
MKKLLELITNGSGRLSASDSALAGAFIVSSIIMLWQGFHYQLNELLLGCYLAAWVTQSQATKRAAIKRDNTRNKDNLDQ